jgi:hypothetical protein
MQKYGFTTFPESILITFKVYDSEINPISLKELALYKMVIGKDSLYVFNKPLPLTVDHRKYGVTLTPNFDSNGIITYLQLPNNLGSGNVFIGFGYKYIEQLKVLGKSKSLINFKSSDSYYLLNNSLLVYLVVNNNKSTKYIFDSSGILITIVEDVIIDSHNFTRVMGNVYIVIRNNRVVDYNLEIKLSPIQVIPKKVMDRSNTNFGTLDLETYMSNDGYNKVYAAGFYCKGVDGHASDKIVLSLFYIDKSTMNSANVILDCINALLIKD